SEGDGNDTGIVFADVNGDGRVDALVSRSGKNGQLKDVLVFINDPDAGWKCDQKWTENLRALNLPFTRDGRGDLGVRVIDLNGDGLPDIIASFGKGNQKSRAWLNNGHEWQEDELYSIDPKLLPGMSFSY